MKKSIKVALYVRVSTDEQDLDHQEEDLRDEARRRGWKISGLYRETVSGVSQRRPELARLRHDAALHRFGAVLVWSISRLGRNALEVLGIAEELLERGVGVVSYREPAVDTTSAMGRMVLQIGAAFAEFERAELSARTRSGLEGARRRGKRIGRPPRDVDGGQVLWLLEQGNSVPGVAKLHGCSISTIKRAAARARAARQAQNRGARGVE